MERISRRQFHARLASALPTLSALPALQAFAAPDANVSTAATGASGAGIAQGERVKVLLVTGQNNHDWTRTSPLLKAILESTGKFVVTTSTTPAKGAPPAEWDAWKPDFASYAVVLSDYNGEMWPERVRTSFESYIRGGGTAQMQHAANNPFAGWTAFEQMVGLLWRDANTGARIYLTDRGQPVKVPAGEDVGAGHTALHDWRLTHRQTGHPILKGLPPVWMHAHDELYHGQRGPAEGLEILASAWSDPAQKGTGKHEPILWWIPFGQGKVLTFVAGHLWAGQQELDAFRCVGFRTIVQRGAEWLATGQVTLPMPPNFPTPDRTSMVG